MSLVSEACNDNVETETGAMFLSTLRDVALMQEIKLSQYERLRAAVYWLNADEFDPRGLEALEMLADLLEGKTHTI